MNYTPPNPAIQTTAFSRDNSTQGYFTESQLCSEVERVRRATIEECAVLMESQYIWLTIADAAKIIRNIK